LLGQEEGRQRQKKHHQEAAVAAVVAMVVVAKQQQPIPTKYCCSVLLYTSPLFPFLLPLPKSFHSPSILISILLLRYLPSSSIAFFHVLGLSLKNYLFSSHQLPRLVILFAKSLASFHVKDTRLILTHI
jgi:hypothetical protein